MLRTTRFIKRFRKRRTTTVGGSNPGQLRCDKFNQTLKKSKRQLTTSRKLKSVEVGFSQKKVFKAKKTPMSFLFLFLAAAAAATCFENYSGSSEHESRPRPSLKAFYKLLFHICSIPLLPVSFTLARMHALTCTHKHSHAITTQTLSLFFADFQSSQSRQCSWQHSYHMNRMARREKVRECGKDREMETVGRRRKMRSLSEEKWRER